MVEETVTISTVYMEPNPAEPTQDSTKDFTPRVETATVRDSTPRKPLRTEVRSISRPMQEFVPDTVIDICELKKYDN